MDTPLPSSSTFLGQSTRMGAASGVTLGSAPLSVIRDCPPPHVALVGIRVGDAPHTVGPGVGPGGPAELPCGCCPRPHSPNRASPAAGDLGPGIGDLGPERRPLGRPGHVAESESSDAGRPELEVLAGAAWTAVLSLLHGTG